MATFDINATPPIDSCLAYNPVINSWDLSLRARGIILLGSGQPIILCAVDWLSIDSESLDAFRQTLAEAVGTDMKHVTVHTVHQHDAPGCYCTVERILKEHGITHHCYEGTFPRELLQCLGKAAKDSLVKTQLVTHIGLGSAPVYKVTSSRRIVGPDGKVGNMRIMTIYYGSHCSPWPWEKRMLRVRSGDVIQTREKRWLRPVRSIAWN